MVRAKNDSLSSSKTDISIIPIYDLPKRNNANPIYNLKLRNAMGEYPLHDEAKDFKSVIKAETLLQVFKKAVSDLFRVVQFTGIYCDIDKNSDQRAYSAYVGTITETFTMKDKDGKYPLDYALDTHNLSFVKTYLATLKRINTYLRYHNDLCSLRPGVYKCMKHCTSRVLLIYFWLWKSPSFLCYDLYSQCVGDNCVMVGSSLWLIEMYLDAIVLEIVLEEFIEGTNMLHTIYKIMSEINKMINDLKEGMKKDTLSTKPAYKKFSKIFQELKYFYCKQFHVPKCLRSKCK